jgi:CII-binding regulator of phage lambda lysogenization HflD
MSVRNYFTNNVRPSIITEAKSIYKYGDNAEDVMWALASIYNKTLANEQKELLEAIDEWWWYITGDEE